VGRLHPGNHTQPVEPERACPPSERHRRIPCPGDEHGRHRVRHLVADFDPHIHGPFSQGRSYRLLLVMCSGTGASTCSRKSPRLPPGLLPPGAPPSGTLVPLHPPACARLSEDGTRLGRPVRSCLCAVLGAQLALGRPGRRDPLPAGLSELRAHWRRVGLLPDSSRNPPTRPRRESSWLH